MIYFDTGLGEITSLAATLGSGRHVVFLGSKNCKSCLALKDALQRHACSFKFLDSVVWIDLQAKSDASAIGLHRVRALPFLACFADGYLELGWEGFAALAPEELKSAIVTEILSKVQVWLAGDGA